MLDGQSRTGAARRLGLDQIPCIRFDHLAENEQRLPCLAVNRLGEKGSWNLDELKVEFEEPILAEAPIEIAGFTLDEIDQVLLGDEASAIDAGPLAPALGAFAIPKPGDVFLLGRHKLVCGDAMDEHVWRRLMEGDEPARLLLTDEPYNVKIKGNVSLSGHREFPMASSKMSDAEFAAFNDVWIGAALPWLCDGAVLGTFIDWRGYPTVHVAAAKASPSPLNLVVWEILNGYEMLGMRQGGDSLPALIDVEFGDDVRALLRGRQMPGPCDIETGKRRMFRIKSRSDASRESAPCAPCRIGC